MTEENVQIYMQPKNNNELTEHSYKYSGGLGDVPPSCFLLPEARGHGCGRWDGNLGTRKGTAMCGPTLCQAPHRQHISGSLQKTLPENHHCHPGSPGSQSTEKSVWSRSHSRGPWEAVELAFQQGQLSEEESQLQALPPEILAPGQGKHQASRNNSAYTKPSRAPQCPPDKDLIQGCHGPVM